MNAAAVKLGNLFAARPPTVNPARYPDETFELYSVPAYDRGTPDILLGRDIGSAKQVVAPGDVLLSRIVPHIRRAWVVGKRSDHRMLASSEWIVLNSERTHPRYLRFLLTSDEFHRHFMTTVGGVGGSLLRAQRDQVAQIEACLPELDEQERVANALGVVSQSIELESLAVSRSIVLKAEALSELFTRGLRGEEQKDTEIGRIPESWDAVRLGDVARIGNGSTPNRKVTSYWGGDIPYITSAKMYERNILVADEFVTEDALRDYSLPRLKPGTILLAIVGQGKTLGHCAILEVEATVSRHVGYLILDEARVLPWFCRYYLEMQYKVLRSLAAGNGSTRGALTAGLLKQVLVPVPTASEQREITEILGALDQKIELHKRKRVLLDELFKALLNGFMTGKIQVSDLNLRVLEKPSPDGVVVTNEAVA